MAANSSSITLVNATINKWVYVTVVENIAELQPAQDVIMATTLCLLTGTS